MFAPNNLATRPIRWTKCEKESASAAEMSVLQILRQAGILVPLQTPIFNAIERIPELATGKTD